jgi:hypothetical protein
MKEESEDDIAQTNMLEDDPNENPTSRVRKNR